MQEQFEQMKRTRETALGREVLVALAWLWLSSTALAQVITVTVDRNTTISTSQFVPGISQIDNSLDFPWTGNNGAAVTNARSLVAGGIHWMNSHIMAWGIPDTWPDPAQPGPTIWSTLDSHVKGAVDLGSTPVITLCEAPWWMKGNLQADGSTDLIPDVSAEWSVRTNSSSVTDYRGIVYPAGYVTPDPFASRVLDNQMTNWLSLVEAVARRYLVPPYNVRHFQVWNEFKGYWNSALNRWDYDNSPGDPAGYNAKHGYTYMYNQVYGRLKSVAASLGLPPESINVGGPYVVMSSGSSSNQVGGFPSGVTGPWGVLDRRPLDAFSYWLTNKVGAEFVVCDGANRNKYGTEITDPFSRCDKFAAVNQWIRQQPGAAALPIWWSEWYSKGDDPGPWPDDFNAALGAYSAIQQIKSGAALTLLWGGEYQMVSHPPLWTPSDTTGGGQPTPWYFVYKSLGNYFGRATTLCATTSSSPSLAVLASPEWTMLVNKLAAPVAVSLDGTTTNLAAYGVVLLPAPSSLLTPRPPVGLRAQPASSARINLAWTDASTNETGFAIWRAIEGSPYVLLTQVGANTTNYADAALGLDTTYFYYVRAFNATGSSVTSVVATARTMPFAFYEAEQLPVAAASVGDTCTTYTDVNLSQGQGAMFDSDRVDDFVTYSVSVPEAGTYNVTLRATKSTDRGSFQFAVAPVLLEPYTNVGAIQDLYASSRQPVQMDVGFVSFDIPGNYCFRGKLAGKNASSTGYKLAFDYLLLAPVAIVNTNRPTVGHWRFENSAKLGLDSGGSGLRLTMAGTPMAIALPGDNSGLAGARFSKTIPSTGLTNTGAVQLVGASYWTYPDGPWFNISQQLTVEAYFNIASFPDGVTQTFAAQYSDVSGRRGWIFSAREDNFTAGQVGIPRLRFTVSGDGNSVYGQFATQWELLPNHDYYAAVVYNAGAVRFYLADLTNNHPGMLTQSFNSYPTSIFDSTTNFTIGFYPASAPGSFTGLLDEVRVSRVALTPEQLLISQFGGVITSVVINGGSVEINGLGTAGLSYSLLRSINLADWTVVGSSTATNGVLHLVNAAPLSSAGYYRLRRP